MSHSPAFPGSHYCLLHGNNAWYGHHTMSKVLRSNTSIFDKDAQLRPKPVPPPLILHQPHKSQFRVNFRFLAQILNGISVSGPPFFGERPYPRQIHPVENTLIFDNFRPKTTIYQCYQHPPDNPVVYTTPIYHTHAPHHVISTPNH